MPNEILTEAELLALAPNNTTGLITAQTLRNIIVSSFNREDDELLTSDSEITDDHLSNNVVLKNQNNSFSTGQNVTGTVTATTFSGSGASLTNIPDAALTNNVALKNQNNNFSTSQTVTGTVTATTFSGSGASLTSIPDAALTANVALKNANNNFSTSQTVTGTVTATTFSGSGSGLNALNGSSISTGTVPNNRTSGVSTATAASLVLRDGSGGAAFGGTLTVAQLSGSAAWNTSGAISTSNNLSCNGSFNANGTQSIFSSPSANWVDIGAAGASDCRFRVMNDYNGDQQGLTFKINGSHESEIFSDGKLTIHSHIGKDIEISVGDDDESIGGDLILLAASNTDSGNGGAITLTGGDAGGEGFSGGSITLTGGTCDNAGGSIVINGGNIEGPGFITLTSGSASLEIGSNGNNVAGFTNFANQILTHGIWFADAVDGVAWSSENGWGIPVHDGEGNQIGFIKVFDQV